MPSASPTGRVVKKEAFRVVAIPLSQLEPAPWNANRVAPGLLKKIRHSIETFGIVENLVVRPLGRKPPRYEVISGNHRLGLYADMGLKAAPCVVVEVDDAHARLLAQTLNRTRGSDDRDAYKSLLEEALAALPIEEVTALLPETDGSIAALLGDLSGQETPPRPIKPPSKLGQIYELGDHRLLCGDATDREQVEELLEGETPALMATDPPYGVGVDHTWRDGVTRPIAASRTGLVANDDRVDWSEAFLLSQAPVAYVWHSALHASEAQAALLTAGFTIRAQIVWVKSTAPVSRSHYHWRHEPCWYAVRKGAAANWLGGRKQTTVWESASPIAAYGGGIDDASTLHPTQKPVSLFERPIANHTQAGDVVYEPFAGSGSQFIAAERLGRRCFGIEIDPSYYDVIRARYQAYAAV